MTEFNVGSLTVEQLFEMIKAFQETVVPFIKYLEEKLSKLTPEQRDVFYKAFMEATKED